MIDLVSYLALGVMLIAFLKRRWWLSPPKPEDGMHRPDDLEPRTRGRLIAWSGAVRRAP